MSKKIRVGILDDHQVAIDGYIYRLEKEPDIEIVGTAAYGAELEPMLAQQPLDVLLLDVNVPESPDNPNPYPILHRVPRLLERYANIYILVISMHAQRTLIHALMEAGITGYVLKDDRTAIRDLAAIVRNIANGGVYISPRAYEELKKRSTGELSQPLSKSQLAALSLCIAYPDAKESELADKMGVAHSTLRNLLSQSYLKLGVRSRSAAIVRAGHLGLIPPDIAPPTG